jgi:hypothetical protein
LGGSPNCQPRNDEALGRINGGGVLGVALFLFALRFVLQDGIHDLFKTHRVQREFFLIRSRLRFLLFGGHWLPMSKNNLSIICQCLAEDAYVVTLLAAKMIDAKILEPGEIQKMRETMPERELEFCRDYIEKLKGLGLRDEGL